MTTQSTIDKLKMCIRDRYCSYCMMALALAFYRIVNMNKSNKRRCFILLYALIFANALLTLSRSALICLFICQVMSVSYTHLDVYKRQVD